VKSLKVFAKRRFLVNLIEIMANLPLKGIVILRSPRCQPEVQASYLHTEGLVVVAERKSYQLVYMQSVSSSGQAFMKLWLRTSKLRAAVPFD
jgi:hypothetical protein